MDTRLVYNRTNILINYTNAEFVGKKSNSKSIRDYGFIYGGATIT